MKKNWNKPAVSMETAGLIRERYLEGDSINSLSRRYGLQRGSIKGILKGTTYNKFGEFSNLMEIKKRAELF
jgi:hypothetical protein